MGYIIYWYCSSEKKKLDILLREKRVQKADRQLTYLSLRLNKRKLKTMKQIREEIDSILNKYNVEYFFNITICENKEETKGQIGKGRSGPNTKYESLSKTRYSLIWELNKKRLCQEGNVDGIDIGKPSGEIIFKKKLNEFLEPAKEILLKYRNKIILPLDYAYIQSNKRMEIGAATLPLPIMRLEE